MKGSAVVWAYILIGLFTVTLLYIIFSQVIYVNVQPTVFNHLTVTNTTDTTDAVATLNLIEDVWTWWPVIFILGLLLIGIIASQRREPDEYYYA